MESCIEDSDTVSTALQLVDSILLIWGVIPEDEDPTLN